MDRYRPLLLLLLHLHMMYFPIDLKFITHYYLHYIIIHLPVSSSIDGLSILLIDPGGKKRMAE